MEMWPAPVALMMSTVTLPRLSWIRGARRLASIHHQIAELTCAIVVHTVLHLQPFLRVIQINNVSLQD